MVDERAIVSPNPRRIVGAPQSNAQQAYPQRFRRLTRSKLSLHRSIWVLAFAVAAFSCWWSMQRIASYHLARLSSAISRHVGIRVSIGGVRPLLPIGIAFTNVSVTGIGKIQRVQVYTCPSNRRSICQIVLIRPNVRLSLPRIEDASRCWRHPGFFARDNADDSRLTSPKSLLRRLISITSVQDGVVELRHTIANKTIDWTAKNVFVSHKNQGVLVYWKTSRAKMDQHRLSTSATTIALSPHSWRLLGGVFKAVSLSRKYVASTQFSQLVVRRKDDSLFLHIRPDHPQDEAFTARIALTSDGSTWKSARLAASRISLASFAPWLALHGASASGYISGHALFKREQDAISIASNTKVSIASIRHPRLAPIPAGQFQLASRAQIRIRPGNPTQITLSPLRVALGSIALRTSGSFDLGTPTKTTSVDLKLELLPAKCQSILNSLPSALKPMLAGMRVHGLLGGQTTIRIGSQSDSRQLVSWDLRPMTCAVTRDAPAADPALLENKDEHMVTDSLGIADSIRLRPARYRLHGASDLHQKPMVKPFTPLKRIPSIVQKAFIYAEDARFYHHDGFDAKQLAKALADGIRQRSITRGASSITQQLVKNVFLTHERTLARKLQEMIITWRLEQTLSKKRILELYLNIIELGPDIRGVAQAAEHYFSKSLSQLTLRQAAQLATLAPNPYRFGDKLRAKQMTLAYNQRVRRLMRHLNRDLKRTRNQRTQSTVAFGSMQ